MAKDSGTFWLRYLSKVRIKERKSKKDKAFTERKKTYLCLYVICNSNNINPKLDMMVLGLGSRAPKAQSQDHIDSSGFFGKPIRILTLSYSVYPVGIPCRPKEP